MDTYIRHKGPLGDIAKGSTRDGTLQPMGQPLVTTGMLANHTTGGQVFAPRADAGRGCEAESPAKPLRVRNELGELPFVICRDGSWLYKNSPIGRKELVCLFASILKREADGSYWLETPVERGRIVVEDVPFVAVELDWTCCGDHQVLSLRTNVDQVVTADTDHPIRVRVDAATGAPTPYVTVRPANGAPAMEARICRAVYYELVALAVPEMVDGRPLLGVWSRGAFFPLGDLPSDE